MPEDIKKLQDLVSTLTGQVQALMTWKEERENTQLKEPLDDASKAAIGAILDGGGALIDPDITVNIGATPTSISVPITPSGFRAIDIGGSRFYIATYTP